ncbi:MAG: bifunctional phosphoribosylaminoimidazolecarboxamide formyltransferase/IMP cyclohydrolase [Deltaproteobacteria bacterium]|nr:bifunctional phosphoribosylaminoimidazolecarboxamide formyltransferase/IMP cyclohydrolase [Deltaproteobacteria bacterium]
MSDKRYALLSTWNKEGLVPFASGLAKLGFRILSTGGTAKVLQDAGISVTDLESYTGAPEILRGRVKSLHPKIFAGILGVPEFEDHAADLEAQGIEVIDLVVVNFYPFEEVIGKGGSSFSEAIEHIDIGGPSLVRAAAKNCRRSTVVVDPADYKKVLSEMREFQEVRWQTRLALAHKAFRLTAHYDAIISNYFTSQTDHHFSSPAGETFTLTGREWKPLRYGENPHQRGWAFQVLDDGSEASVIGADQMNGEPLSYTNIIDADAALNLVLKLASPACVIVKHGNPCGAAEGALKLNDAYMSALQCDDRSAFGGIVAVNECIDKEFAQQLMERFFEVIIAPEVSPEAQEVFKQKGKLKVLRWKMHRTSLFAKRPLAIRSVSGGFLVQEKDMAVEETQGWRMVTKRKPTAEQMLDLSFALRVATHVASNAIVLAKDRVTVGIGAGQMSRIDALEIAVQKGERVSGSVLASDAFFPFRDSVDRAAAVGVSAIIQPGGSRRDDEVIAAADEKGMVMVFTGVRHFRH